MASVMDSAMKVGLILYFWLKEPFLVNDLSQRPLLLLLDGTGLISSSAAINLQMTIKRSFFCHLPYTTHECQPLYFSVFETLKQHWQDACHKFYRKNLVKSMLSSTSAAFFEICGEMLSTLQISGVN